MSVKSYQVTLLIDATAYAEVEAESAEQAYSIAADRAGNVTLCHQCTNDVETGDCYGAIVYSDDGENVEFTREAELESKLSALKEENERLRSEIGLRASSDSVETTSLDKNNLLQNILTDMIGGIEG